MLAECDTQGKKITLEHRYAAFNQLRVDIKLQSKDANKEIAALELAEKRKNTCLGWLQENWDYQPPKITYQDMQKLLNPKTAAIFWHISPNAITTFIVKHNQPTIVLSPQPRRKKRKQNILSFNSFFGNSQQSEQSKAYLEQLQSFQSWIKEWKQDYQDYCQKDYTGVAKKAAPWRKKMKGLLESLSSILEINRIKEHLTGIEQVILIPHRELHLLPLDYLFPPRFNITYLPSFQIGLKLLAQAPVIKKPVSQILNVTDDYLVFNAIESIILNTIYPSCNKLEVETVTQKSLTTALQNNSGYFHFSGHGYHVPDNPRDSALALASSEKLTLGDIFDNQQLDLSKYELICLSACETGITSTDSLLDEYVGLVSGFLAKGATYVLSTLWNVDERSTALFMIQFYQLMQQGNTPTIALKQAKKWLRQLTYKQLAKWYFDLSEKLHHSQCKEYLKTEVSIIENDKSKLASFEQIYAHPYYWAGFILTGKAL
ncbi:MAG: CHAT domain-containing protein [Cyanobacteria bacterium J06633_8]